MKAGRHPYLQFQDFLDANARHIRGLKAKSRMVEGTRMCIPRADALDFRTLDDVVGYRHWTYADEPYWDSPTSYMMARRLVRRREHIEVVAASSWTSTMGSISRQTDGSDCLKDDFAQQQGCMSTSPTSGTAGTASPARAGTSVVPALRIHRRQYGGSLSRTSLRRALQMPILLDEGPENGFKLPPTKATSDAWDPSGYTVATCVHQPSMARGPPATKEDERVDHTHASPPGAPPRTIGPIYSSVLKCLDFKLAFPATVPRKEHQLLSVAVSKPRAEVTVSAVMARAVSSSSSVDVSAVAPFCATSKNTAAALPENNLTGTSSTLPRLDFTDKVVRVCGGPPSVHPYYFVITYVNEVSCLRCQRTHDYERSLNCHACICASSVAR